MCTDYTTFKAIIIVNEADAALFTLNIFEKPICINFAFIFHIIVMQKVVDKGCIMYDDTSQKKVWTSKDGCQQSPNEVSYAFQIP